MDTMNVREEVLTKPMAGLEQALACEYRGHERDWIQRVSAALTNVEQALRVHAAAAEAADGLLSHVDLTRPTLARQVSDVRREHSILVEQARALQQQLRTAAQAFQPIEQRAKVSGLPEPSGPASPIPDFGMIRQSADRLVFALHHHSEVETDLLLESVNTDIGVGD